MKRVFSVIVLVLETTFYLVVLLCTILFMMGEFYVDDKYGFKERKIRDQCYVMLFIIIIIIFNVVENGLNINNGVRL
jgi:hypothetical protein